MIPHSDNFKCLHVSLDFLELLLTSLPEALVDKIEDFLRWLIKLRASQKGGEPIMTKAQDLLQLAQEMLSADVMLPNLVAVITEDMLITANANKRPQSSGGQNNGFNSFEITLKS